ncbi:MAG: hypothetical protein AB1689_22270 [Thermodesulfobacteriota bacterium]
MRRSPIALPAVAALVTLLAGEHARAQTTHPLYACAHRIAGGLRGLAEDVTHALLDCETDRLATGSPADCAVDTRLAARLANIVDDLPRLANHSDCDTAGNPADQSQTRFRALCPIESRTTSLFTERVGGDGSGTVLSDLGTLADDLFVSVYDGCPQPTARVSAGARECATLIADAATRELEQLVQCYYGCERAHLADDDFCVDPSTGAPTADDVLSCIEGHAEDIAEVTGSGDKCSAAEIVELGCPLGATEEATLVDGLTERLTSYAQAFNRKTYHSSCRTSLPGPPIELVPAEVTLEPSMTKTRVSCGQVLDAAFFGGEQEAELRHRPRLRAGHRGRERNRRGEEGRHDQRPRQDASDQRAHLAQPAARRRDPDRRRREARHDHRLPADPELRRRRARRGQQPQAEGREEHAVPQPRGRHPLDVAQDQGRRGGGRPQWHRLRPVR